MNEQTSLWSNSRAWRWLLLSNLTLSVIVIFFGPWNQTTQKPVTSASYSNPNIKTNAGASPTYKMQKGFAVNGRPVKAPLHQKNSQIWDYDNTFNINSITPIEVYPAGTKLHIIGAYEPQRDNTSPNWRNCVGINDSELRKNCIEDEHRAAQIAKNKPGNIDVIITDSSPMVLVLSAYEPVNWNIKTSTGTNIKRIILGGYKSQSISGLPPNIPVDVYSRLDYSCARCTNHANYFYVYKNDGSDFTKKLDQIISIAGLPPTSFQGGYKAKSYSIGSLTKTTLAVGASKKAIVDKEYEGTITLNNGTVNLPEGLWKVLAYGIDTSRSSNLEAIVLGNVKNGKLKGLVSASLRENNQGNGYAKKIWCERTETYFSHVTLNKAKGKQKCYWVDHVTDLWNQPIFGLAEKRLLDMGVMLPRTFLNAAYHEADRDYSQTIYYLENPEIHGVKTRSTGRDANYWHSKKIAEHPDKAKLVEEYVKSSKIWFQILDAIS